MMGLGTSNVCSTVIGLWTSTLMMGLWTSNICSIVMGLWTSNGAYDGDV